MELDNLWVLKCPVKSVIGRDKPCDFYLIWITQLRTRVLKGIYNNNIIKSSLSAAFDIFWVLWYPLFTSNYLNRYVSKNNKNVKSSLSLLLTRNNFSLASKQNDKLLGFPSWMKHKMDIILCTHSHMFHVH